MSDPAAVRDALNRTEAELKTLRRVHRTAAAPRNGKRGTRLARKQTARELAQLEAAHEEMRGATHE